MIKAYINIQRNDIRSEPVLFGELPNNQMFIVGNNLYHKTEENYALCLNNNTLYTIGYNTGIIPVDEVRVSCIENEGD